MSDCPSNTQTTAAVHWAADLTDGRAVAPWRASSLAFATKVRMYQLYCDDPVRCAARRAAGGYEKGVNVQGTTSWRSSCAGHLRKRCSIAR